MKKIEQWARSQVKPNAIKLRALPVFPSRVNRGTGLARWRANGVYDFSIDFSNHQNSSTVTSPLHIENSMQLLHPDLRSMRRRMPNRTSQAKN
jgi:hypothetical protein